MDPSLISNNASWGAHVPSGKRQRIFNMMKQTKDTYLNVAKNSIKNYYGDEQSMGDSRGMNSPVFPPKLLCYPSYSRRLSAGGFETHIRGLVYSTGHKSKRNSLLFSICKQFLRSDAPLNFEQRLESLENDSNASLESGSTTSSSASSYGSNAAEASQNLTQEQILRQRISGFMVRNLPNVNVLLRLYNEKSQEAEQRIISDSSGSFDLMVRSDFKPTAARLQCVDTGLVEEAPIFFVENSGVGLISDIDDTIKHTGVVGDKRSIFLNVFVNGFDEWKIKDMPLWYKTLKDSRLVDFFYVSNAPSQIYPILSEYIGENYPPGPMFLKHYSGNLLSSIMKSSAQRKLSSILRICNDFPDKKFILVGDSGEQDLEAYVSTASQFPDQIIGIYIRCCKNSMSDESENDTKVMRSLNQLIQTEYLSKSKETKKQHEPFPDLIQFDSDVESDSGDVITKKRAPEVPKRKPILAQNLQDEISNSRIHGGSVPPPLPTRKPARLKMRSLENAVYSMPSSQNDYGTYSEFFDKKAEAWNERVKVAISRLIDNGVDTKFMFFNDPIECLEDSLNKIDSLK